MRDLLADDPGSGGEADAQQAFIDNAAKQYVEVEVRYSGYLKREREGIARIASHEDTAIPADFNYDELQGLLKATREFLNRVRPATIGPGQPRAGGDAGGHREPARRGETRA